MTWINALGWSGLITLAVIPPVIILLYFLKLRRRPLEVPSTLLWQKTIEDMHVNSLWQRLRNNLLLWLQILAVILLLLAGLRPGCQGTKLTDTRFVFLIDVSASMAATDLESGTRLDTAKRELDSTIDRMKAGDTAMIVAFSDTAEIVQSFTRDTNLLKRKAQGIRQTTRRSDISEALVAASGLANPGRTSTDAGDVQVAAAQPATMMIFSDGGFREVPDFSLGNLTPEYRAIGAVETPVNFGVTAFSLGDPGASANQQQAFAQLYNGSASDAAIDVSLFANGQLFDSQRAVAVPAKRSTGISFELSGLLANVTGPVELLLKIETADALSVDNESRLIVNPAAPAQILVVSPDNEYLRLALTTADVARLATVTFRSPDFLESDEYKSRATLGEYAFVIFDRAVPASMPTANTMMFDAVPPGAEWSAGEAQYPTSIVDLDRSHPVMSNLNLGELLIVEGRALTGPSGSQSLLDATYGSIITIGPRFGFMDLVIGFPLISLDENGNPAVNTNWPSRLSFPLFIQNVVNLMAGETQNRALSGAMPGQVLRLRAPQGAAACTILTPGKERIASRVEPDGFVQFSQTDQTGVYDVAWQGQTESAQKFAVNLMDVNESTLTVREQLELGFEKVDAVRQSEPARREFWRWLAALSLVVLAVEWYIYNRRVLI